MRILKDFYGLAVLAACMAFAAGYYLSVPGELARFVPFLAYAPTPEDTTHARFGICGHGPRVNCIVDGDTVYVRGDKIRLSDINTPELFSPQCRREAELAARAQKRLQELMNQGPIKLQSGVGRDRDVYGRKLRKITHKGRSVGDYLVAEGLAHKWRGHKQSWCS
ncbi:thermonuclease family protein [Nitratireductor basaltis]|uniref:thermonuclease family protein n=1 Tax=Nitratireductor basaltis TaxID=472175 RepID=UPI000AE3E7AA|nr:thermonuclease family protein [Nitratireductor basaltis]